MSKTIRNEQTKGFLDKLQVQRKTRKLIRCLKADEWFCDEDLELTEQFE